MAPGLGMEVQRGPLEQEVKTWALEDRIGLGWQPHPKLSSGELGQASLLLGGAVRMIVLGDTGFEC